MKTFIPTLAIIALLCSPITKAESIVLWDFNNSNTLPSIGSATTTYNFSGGINSQTTFPTGTTLGAPPNVAAGQSLRTSDLINIFSNIRFEGTAINLTGKTSTTLTFAVDTNYLFELGETLSVYTTLNNGNTWTLRSTLANPTSGNWQLYEVDLSSLDGLDNTGFSIRSQANFEAVKYFAFDNILITAVPEPNLTALAILGTILALALLRKVKRSKG